MFTARPRHAQPPHPDGSATRRHPGRSHQPVTALGAVVAMVAALVTPIAAAGPAAADPTGPAGPPTALAFSAQPGTGDPDTDLGTQPAVTLQGSEGQPVDSDATVTLTLHDPTALDPDATELAQRGHLPRTLTCDQTDPETGITAMAATSGTAAFSGCRVSAGGLYTLTATSSATGDRLATSEEFFVSGPAQLAFSAQPSGAAAGATWATQPQVTVQDARGQTVGGNADTIALYLTPGTGAAGAALTCTQTATETADGTTTVRTTAAATTGIARFDGCAIDRAGAGYTLQAFDTTSGIVTTSDAVTIAAGPPSGLVWATQPYRTTAGSAFATPPSVTVIDAAGNPITDFTGTVTLALTDGTGTAGAELGCTDASVTAEDGVATFPDCHIDRAGDDYTLTASTTDPELTSPPSRPFDITAGAAAQLRFATQPGGTGGSVTGGIPLDPQPAVAVADSAGNGVSATVRLSIASGPDGATLTCQQNPISTDATGLATFDGCRLDRSGRYTLSATAGGQAATSHEFSVTQGKAASLRFSAQPAGDAAATGGIPWTAQPVVTVTDAAGQPAGDAVTLTLTPGVGAADATLTCAGGTTSSPGSDGRAAFSGCRIDRAGSYRLTATAGGAVATSAGFTVAVGAPAQLAYLTQPGGGTGGTPWATQPVVQIQDAGGNPVTSSTATIALTRTPGTGPGDLTCTDTALPAVRGVVAFAGCAIDRAGERYTLTAAVPSDDAVPPLTSAPVPITTGEPARLAFTAAPRDGEAVTAGIPLATQPQVTVVDAGGNPVAGTGEISLSLTPGTGAAGARLDCDAASVTPSSGVAAFAGCTVDTAAGGYTLTATGPAGLSAESRPFSVLAPPPSELETAPTPVPLAQTFGGQRYAANPTSVVHHVNTATGSLTFAATDLTVAGLGVPLNLVRTYNSADTTGGVFGPGWTSVLDTAITIEDRHTAVVRGDDGQTVVYTKSSHGHGGHWTAPPGAHGSLACTYWRCSLDRADGVTVTFAMRHTGHGRHSSATGRISGYTATATGRGLHFAWGRSSVTISVATTDVRPYRVHVTLNRAGRATGVATPAGRTVAYSYTDGLLTSFTDADQHTWTYDYDAADRLIRTTDPEGAVRLTASYDQTGRVGSVRLTGSTQHADDTFSWTAGSSPGSGTAVRSARTMVDGTLTRQDYVHVYRGRSLVRQVLPTGAVLRYAYDREQNLTAVQDPLGWVQQMGYDRAGNLTSQTTPLGAGESATVWMSYDRDHRLIRRTDARGNTTRYHYGHGRRGATTVRIDPPGHDLGATTLTFDRDGLLVRKQGPTSWQTFDHDAAGNRTGVHTYAERDADWFDHGRSGHGRSDHGRSGHGRSDHGQSGHGWFGAGWFGLGLFGPGWFGFGLADALFGRHGHGTTREAGNGKGSISRYDEAGNLVSHTTARGTTGDAAADEFTSTWTYDNVGHLTSVTIPGRGTTSYTYSAAGDLTSSTDPDGTTTTYSWDEDAGTFTSATDAGATVQTFDPSGNLVAQGTPTGQQTRFLLGAAGQAVVSIEPTGRVVRQTYDLLGRPVRTADDAGNVVTRQFDAAGRKIRQVANGAVTRTGYDAAGNVISSTDAAGHVTTASYTAAGQIASVSTAAGTTRYRYNDAGDLARKIGPNHTVTRYRYSVPGQRISQTVASGTDAAATTRYDYDVDGNLISITDPDRRSTEYTLDAANRPIATTYQQPGQPSIAVTRSYDGLGRLTGMTDPTGEHTYRYDAHGNLTSVSGPSGTFRYDYSTAGTITETYPDGTTITHTVDDGGYLMSLTAGTAGQPGYVSVAYLRDAQRRTTGVAMGDGTVESRRLDATGGLLSTTLRNADGVLASDEYTYDAGGNLLSSTRTVLGTRTIDRYGYDDAGRLIGYTSTSSPADGAAPTGFAPESAAPQAVVPEAHPQAPTPQTPAPFTVAQATAGLAAVTRQASMAGAVGTAATDAGPTISYDAAGNRTRWTLGGETTQATYNARGQLVSRTGPDGRTRFAYDRAGNLTSITGPESTQTFDYDAAAHLVQVTTTTGQATTTVRYTYDGDGNRVSKTVDGGQTTGYVWDIAGPYPRLVAETDGTDTIRRYYYGEGPVAMQTADGDLYYYHLGAVGSVTSLTDADGDLVAAYHYDAFGQVTVDTPAGSTAPANPLLFQGQYLDADTGLYNMRARNYDPATGRFTQPDPLQLPIGAPTSSPYVFADNNPATRTDPTGQYSVEGFATHIFWGRPTRNSNIVNDTKYGVAAVEVVGKVGMFAAEKLGLVTSSTKVAARAADIAEGVDLATAAKTGAKLDKVGLGFSVVGIGLSSYVMIDDCMHGSPYLCAADATALAIDIAFTVGCTFVSAATLAVFCGLGGAFLSVIVAQVIIRLGPAAVAGLTAEYYAAAAAVGSQLTDAGRALTDAGAAVAGFANDTVSTVASGFNQATTAVSSGFEAALGTLVGAGYTAAQLGTVLRDGFRSGVDATASALIDLGYDISGVGATLAGTLQMSAGAAATFLSNTYGYSAGQVADALRDGYHLADDEAAAILHDAGYSATQIAAGIAASYDVSISRVASILHDLDVGVDATAAALQQAFGRSAEQVAQTLRTVGVSATQVAGALRMLYNDADDAVASALATAGYTAGQVTAALRDAFSDGAQTVATILRGLATYPVGQVAGALASGYELGASGIGQVLTNVGYGVDEIAAGLADLPDMTAGTVASALRAAGWAAADAAGALVSAYQYPADQAAQAAAEALDAAGYPVEQIAAGLHTTLDASAGAVAAALRGAGYSADQVAGALVSAYQYPADQAAQAAAEALDAAGYPVEQIAAGLHTALGASADTVAGALKALSYNATEVTGALQEAFGQDAAAVAQTLKDVGYAAEEISDVLSGVFGQSSSSIGNLLSDIGFDSGDIRDIGGSFSDWGKSAGDSIKHCFGLC